MPYVLTVLQMATMPVQLLAHIMSLLTLKDRLQSAALVNTSWKAAAIMATNSISVSSMSEQHISAVPSLSGWLMAHGADAAVRSFKIAQHFYNDGLILVSLPLPTQQLRGIEELYLHGIDYAPLQHSNSSSSDAQLDDAQLDDAPALVLSDLTALTRLELSCGQGKLAGLASCTGLQRLLARSIGPEELPFRAEHLAVQLSQALPELTALTRLEPDGPLDSASGPGHVGQHLQRQQLAEATAVPDGAMPVR
jgi:hypothetical protein